MVCLPKHWRQPTQKYRVTYPGVPGEVHLDIIDDKFDDANSSSSTATQSQKFIIEQYKAAMRAKTGRRILRWIYWHVLRFEKVASSSEASTGTIKPIPSDRQCCPDGNCKVCDDGNHHWCRKGCTLFA